MNQSLHDLFESLPGDEPTQEFEPFTPRKRSPRLLPWLIVAGVAIVAIVISIVVVNGVQGNDSAEPTPTPTAESTPTPTPTSTPTPTPEPTPTEPPEDQVPQVEVGDTFTMPIDAWGTSAEVSYKFGTVTYSIPQDSLILSSALINSLPEQCADMRTQWGATKTATGYEVLKPAERCEAAPELYDELWGLTAAMVDSIG